MTLFPAPSGGRGGGVVARSLCCLLLALTCGLPAAAQDRSFESRLREAEKRLLKAKQARPAPAVPKRRPAPRVVRRPAAGKRAAPKRAAARPARRLTAAARPRPAGKRVAQTTPQGAWGKSANLRTVQFSIRPRPAGSGGSARTGDVVLIAEPESVPVFFYLKGGSQLRGTNTAALRDQMPPAKGRIYLFASAPRVGGRAQIFAPVKRGHVTTVRLIFRAAGERSANTGVGSVADE
jgi:hypothetical protein